MSKAIRDTYKADPDEEDEVCLPDVGREPSHPPTGRELAASSPSTRSMQDDAVGLSLSPWGGSVSDSASCLPGPASPLWLWMIADVSLPICTDAWMLAEVSCLLFVLSLSF